MDDDLNREPIPPEDMPPDPMPGAEPSVSIGEMMAAQMGQIIAPGPANYNAFVLPSPPYPPETWVFIMYGVSGCHVTYWAREAFEKMLRDLLGRINVPTLTIADQHDLDTLRNLGMGPNPLLP